MARLDGFLQESTLGGLIREMRPWQWYKQSVMFLGIVFSKSIFGLDAWLNLLLGVFSFCAVASANYIFNDISDLEEDRNHPDKKNRPIAKGQVGIPLAAIFALSLAFAGIYVAYSVGVGFLAVLVGYLALNTVYSVFLKHIVFLDVIVVALCFVLRAVAGVVAINVYLSPWLVFTVLLAALFLVVAKRRREYLIKENPQDSRLVLEDYSEEILDNMFILVSTSLIMSYSLYSFFGASELMMLTLPFAYYSIFRYWYLDENRAVGEKPHKVLFDKPMLLNILLWACVIVAVLYDINKFIGGMLL